MQIIRDYASNPQALPEMRALLRKVCGRSWESPQAEEATELLVLALQEAATNIMRHAYQNERDRPIQLVIDTQADGVAVTLYHFGRDFDPRTVPPPNFDGSREGGFGVYLIEQCVDEVRYERDTAGRSGIHLVKKLS